MILSVIKISAHFKSDAMIHVQWVESIKWRKIEGADAKQRYSIVNNENDP
jgi:hypothetical protein